MTTPVPELTQEERDDIMARLGQIEREKRMLAQETFTATRKDLIKSAAVAPAKVAVGIAGAPGDFRELVKLGYNKGVEKGMPDFAAGLNDPFMPAWNALPTSHDIRSKIEQFTGPWYDPQTRAGQIADTGVQTATTLGRNLITNPRNAARLIAGVTAGTEGAGALTDDNPWARALGGLAGGAYPAFTAAMRDRPGKLVRQAFGDMTPGEIAAAQAMEDAARARGLPLTANESADRGHGFMRAIANHPAAEPIVRRFLADRPQRAQVAAESQLLAMTGPMRAPAENAATAERAATKYIGDAQATRTAAVAPFYNAAAGDTVSPLVAQLMARQEQGRFPQSLMPGEHAALGQQVQALGSPEAWNARFLDQYYRNQRNAIDNPGIAATGAQKTALNATLPTTNAVGFASARSPNIATGRGRYERITENVIDRLKEGPVGVVAGPGGHVPGTPVATERVMGTIGGENARAPQIRESHQQLNGTDPAAFRGMAQTHFETALKQAGGDLITGPPSTLGAKFAKILAGDPVKRQNLEEIVRGVAEGAGRNADEAVQGVNTLMEVMRRTGRTPGVGSPTHPLGENQREMSHTVFGDLLTTPINPLKRAGTLYNDTVTAARYRQVAEAMTSDRAIDALVRMAKLRPEGVTAQFYANVILGLDKAGAP